MLDDIIQNYAYKKNMTRDEIDKEKLNRRSFCDFVAGLLKVDPKDRWTPGQAKGHPFITGDAYTGPYQPGPPPPVKVTTRPPANMGFYPPPHNPQNYPLIPPPIPANSGNPAPNGSHNPGNANANTKKVGNVNMNMLNLGMFNKQPEFNQNPADNYSPRGYFAHMMQQQAHPSQVLGASPSTHNLFPPSYLPQYNHYMPPNIGASPSMPYPQMWNDFGAPNYNNRTRQRSKSDANYTVS